MLDILYGLKILLDLFIFPAQDIGFSMECTNISGDKTVSLHHRSLLLKFAFTFQIYFIRLKPSQPCYSLRSIASMLVPVLFLLYFFLKNLFLIFIHLLYLCFAFLVIIQLILPYRRYESDQVSECFGCPSFRYHANTIRSWKFYMLVGLLYRVTFARVWLETTSWSGTIPTQAFLKR